jgi:hypothetical protein
MKINEFKKLEKKINGHNFNQSYKGINKIMITLSYFGHVASIFLAFFFMSKVLSSAMTDNKIAVFVSSLLILLGLELLKRDIFDKFSIQSLKDKEISKAVTPLLITSLILISGSFYSSINGAKEFSLKTKQIESLADSNISQFGDSLTNFYVPKIEQIEGQNIELFESNKQLDQEARELPITWTSSKNSIRSRIDVNNKQIEKNDERIAQLKSERDLKISEYKSELLTNTSKDKEENSKNSFIFVIISTLIELVILGGVYFSEYYKLRSYKEFREKIEKDPNYQKWLLYDEMLSILITDDTKMNEKLPSNKAIIEMCKVNDIIVLPKDVVSFIKIITGLNIIKSSGSAKYVSKTREMAQEILRKNFNIE